MNGTWGSQENKFCHSAVKRIVSVSFMARFLNLDVNAFTKINGTVKSNTCILFWVNQ
jgi:hypothetical protein